MQNSKIINRIKGIVSIIAVVALFIMMGRDNIVYAASATINISSSTVTQGQEVKVTVDISADASIGAYNFYLEYDASVLEAVSGFEGGGGGRIQLIYDVPDEASLSKKLSKTIKFKAIAPGTTEIKYVCINADDGVIDYDTIENMSVTAKNGTVKVNPPVVASKNNNLASMTVAAVRADGSSYNIPLSPAFSKDVTKYNISVEEGVTDLVVAAKTEDAKAKIYVQWANLDPGDNTTKVIVTAEDGSKKEYVIYTKVPMPETTTPAPVEPIVTVVDGVEYFVENINDAVTLPEGFEAVDYDYNGKTVVAAKGLVKDLTIMYLTTGTGEAGKLFIYDEVNKSFYPMVNVAMSQKLYTIVNAPEGLVIPEGFKESVVTIGDQELNGWQTDDLEGVYLVYAMNWDGKTGLYYYDAVESQMIKYFEMSVEAGVAVDDYNNLVSENESLKSELTKLQATDKEVDNNEVQMYKYIIYIALAVIVILIGVIILVILKRKKDEAEIEEESNDAIDNAFASIISKEEAETENDNDAEEEEEEEWEQSEVLPEGSEMVEQGVNEVEPATEVAAEVTEEPVNEMVAEVAEESVNKVVAEAAEESVNKVVAVTSEESAVERIIEETVTEGLVDAVDESTVEETVEDIVPEIAAEEAIEEKVEDDADIDLSLEADLKNAVADIFEEEAASEVPEEVTDATKELPTLVVEEPADNADSVNKKDEKQENKERVAKILQDENTSIKEEELDMVIDELFDDLFGE